MKRISLFFVGLTACLSMSAQLLPSTQIAVRVTYTETTETPGRFYQYADRYLGTSDVITKKQHYYTLTKIHIQTADADTCYSVDFREPADKPTKLMPVLEEQLIAGSAGRMAESTAKLIYRLREARISLLAGESEQYPQDGQSMRMVLDELKQQEKALTDLYIGEKKVTRHVQTIYLTPQATDSVDTEDILFRFSEAKGLLAADDLSGDPYYIHITPQHANYTPSPKAAKSKDTTLRCLPGKAVVTITDGVDSLAHAVLLIAQYGVSVNGPIEKAELAQ